MNELVAGAEAAGTRSKNLVLTAMIFAVSMTFIDQTIVSIAAPTIQHELSLTSTGIQWAINAYLLTLAALFAFGGRLADTMGHARMVVLGVIIFASASALCGATPKGSIAEAWLIAFRALQGVGAAIMFPAAIAIVVQTFPLRSRGRALALFFGIAGGLTAIGPTLGGFLTQWTWRAIFWVNVPVAIVALVLTYMAHPTTEYKRAPIDYRGLVLIAGGIGLSVLGFQQASNWGWGSAATIGCIVFGLVLLVVFWFVEQRTTAPLMEVSIFRIRPFFVENLVLLLSSIAFVPTFFFASEYAEISLAKSASQASLILLYFFLGFVVAAQIGGRMLDRVGAKRPVVLGCVLAAVGYLLWASRITDLSLSKQVWFVVLAGAGMGFMLGPASTDAVNRASRLTYGEASGITQTVRTYAASLGIAILGTLLVNEMKTRTTDSLVGLGMPHAQAAAQAKHLSQSQSGSGGTIPTFVRLDFAHATHTVLVAMGGVMIAAAAVALVGLRRGVQEETDTAAEPAT
jgi:EmrB/QacA subfamily drug resistance transporter